MKLVEQHIILKSNPNWKRIDELCYLSKNLYNSALYEIKTEYQNTGKFLRYKKLEKFLKNHTRYDSKNTAISLSFRERITIIVDIYRNFMDSISMFHYLLNQFTRVFHTIHRETHLLDDRYVKESVSIMGIGQVYS